MPRPRLSTCMCSMTCAEPEGGWWCVGVHARMKFKVLKLCTRDIDAGMLPAYTPPAEVAGPPPWRYPDELRMNSNRRARVTHITELPAGMTTRTPHTPPTPPQPLLLASSHPLSSPAGVQLYSQPAAVLNGLCSPVAAMQRGVADMTAHSTHHTAHASMQAHVYITAGMRGMMKQGSD